MKENIKKLLGRKSAKDVKRAIKEDCNRSHHVNCRQSLNSIEMSKSAMNFLFSLCPGVLNHDRHHHLPA